MSVLSTTIGRVEALLSWIRKPEYTGENRCMPCTITNGAIAVVAAIVLGLASPPLGILVFAGSVALIYLRGYLVPGTPEFTQRHFPDWLLRAFEKDPRARQHASDRREETTEPVDALTLLQAADAVRDSSEVDDVVLTPWFEIAWWDEIAALDDRHADNSLLADLLDVDADRVSLDWHGSAVVARVDERWAGQWESRPAFVADLAAARVLDQQFTDWADRSLAERSEALGGLRLMLDRCPSCDGRVDIEQTVVKSCCRSYDVIAGTCQGCDARLFELDYDHDAIATTEH